jgi:hypothetical protein
MYKLLGPLLDTKCFYVVVASRCYILKYVNLSKYFFIERAYLDRAPEVCELHPFISSLGER